MTICCTVDCSWKKKGNRRVWLLMALVFAIGAGMALGGGLAGRQCFKQFDDCKEDPDMKAICLDQANDECGLTKYIALIAVGCGLCGLIVPLIGLYFCCCSADDGYVPSEIPVAEPSGGSYGSGVQSFNLAAYKAKHTPHASYGDVEVILVTPPEKDIASRTAPKAPSSGAALPQADADSFGRRAVMEAMKSSTHAQNVPGHPMNEGSQHGSDGGQPGLARISRRTTISRGVGEQLMEHVHGDNQVSQGQRPISRATAELRSNPRV